MLPFEVMLVHDRSIRAEVIGLHYVDPAASVAKAARRTAKGSADLQNNARIEIFFRFTRICSFHCQQLGVEINAHPGSWTESSCVLVDDQQHFDSATGVYLAMYKEHRARTMLHAAATKPRVADTLTRNNSLAAGSHKLDDHDDEDGDDGHRSHNSGADHCHREGIEHHEDDGDGDRDEKEGEEDGGALSSFSHTAGSERSGKTNSGNRNQQLLRHLRGSGGGAAKTALYQQVMASVAAEAQKARLEPLRNLLVRIAAVPVDPATTARGDENAAGEKAEIVTTTKDVILPLDEALRCFAVCTGGVVRLGMLQGSQVAAPMLAVRIRPDLKLPISVSHRKDKGGKAKVALLSTVVRSQDASADGLRFRLVDDDDSEEASGDDDNAAGTGLMTSRQLVRHWLQENSSDDSSSSSDSSDGKKKREKKHANKKNKTTNQKRTAKKGKSKKRKRAVPATSVSRPLQQILVRCKDVFPAETVSNASLLMPARMTLQQLCQRPDFLHFLSACCKAKRRSRPPSPSSSSPPSSTTSSSSTSDSFDSSSSASDSDD